MWNNQAGELWRRTTIAITRAIRRTAKRRGIHPDLVRLWFGKVAEMQRRGVVHYHAIVRLDGTNPLDPTTVLPPPPGFGVGDLVDAVAHAAATTTFTTDPHPTNPAGVPLAAAALQFPLAHPCVSTVLLGPGSVAELEMDLALFDIAIPAGFWYDLRRVGLLGDDVPTPDRGAHE